MNAYDLAFEHLIYCRSKGMSVWAILESIEVDGPKFPTWGFVLDALAIRAGEMAVAV